MKIDNYELRVSPCISESAEGHVSMRHGTPYTIIAKNNSVRRCDAEVSIDGLLIGTFRINAFDYMSLERSPKDNGRFTFYASGSSDASASGEAQVERAEKGLIQVKFVPEKETVTVPKPVLRASVGGACGQSASFVMNSRETNLSYGMEPQSRGLENMSAGVTGLSGHSSQQFSSVGEIERAEISAVTINLRLVGAVNAAEPHPLPGRRGNKVPSPVG